MLTHFRPFQTRLRVCKNTGRCETPNSQFIKIMIFKNDNPLWGRNLNAKNAGFGMNTSVLPLQRMDRYFRTSPSRGFSKVILSPAGETNG